MRTQFRYAVAGIIVFGVLLGASIARSQSGPHQRGIQLREDYQTGKVDGMRILVLRSEGGNFVPVDPARVFRQGDEIRVAFESNFDGYVYVINVSPAGTKRVIFPGRQIADGSNVIRARQRIELPPTSFIFDKETGTEILQVIMSREAVAVLDSAVRESRGELQSAASAAAELSGGAQRGIVSKNVSTVLPQGAGLRARGVFLAEGRDRDRAGSVVAIADEKQSEARLKPGEVALFEIRLQHN
jgi:hypothetical protein